MTTGMSSNQPEISDFEKQRLANIAERDALLKKLTLDAQASELFRKSKTHKTALPTSQKRNKVKDVAPGPRRTSSRLAGLPADGEVVKRKVDEEDDTFKDEHRVKRLRGDLVLGDIVVKGKSWDNGKGFIGDWDGVTKGVARPYERTFDKEDIAKTGDEGLKQLREKMSGLALWEPWDPSRIKLTPERIYSIAMHPTTTKPLIFAGDKKGNLGLLDASQTKPEVKMEDSDDDEDPDPIITTLKPHTRTISGIKTHSSTPQTIYTCSYDSSIRSIDLEKSVAVERYATTNDPSDDGEGISAVDMAATDPSILYFTTLSGILGRHDTRVAHSGDAGLGGSNSSDLFQLSEKKIGGFSLHPFAPHYVSTASLDRFMRIWDLRMIKKGMPQLVGEHENRLSVSHAAFNAKGQVATTSYDDSIKIYNFDGMEHWKVGEKTYGEGEDATLAPDTVVRHNCQTGRWVTILKPHWQLAPQDGVQRLCIGNMNRFVDVYTGQGEQLAQLDGEGITAVPAVTVFHDTQDWIAGGSSSGKLCLWM